MSRSVIAIYQARSGKCHRARENLSTEDEVRRAVNEFVHYYGKDLLRVVHIHGDSVWQEFIPVPSGG